MNEDLVQKISQNIKKSKKYKSVYDKTIERIVGGFATKNTNTKIIEKKSKNLLHQIWGAFYASRPNFEKVADRLKIEIVSGKSAREAVLPILSLQSSVKERIPILSDQSTKIGARPDVKVIKDSGFYKKIFEITGVPGSIIDYACGLNPLTYFWMDLPENSTYTAYDIDSEEVEFLQTFFADVKIKNVSVDVGDVLVDDLVYADVVFLLKLLPCLEHQKKDAGVELIKKLQCKYVVVSFPVKSIGGKKAGMGDFYSNNFRNVIEKEGWKAEEVVFETELVFVVKKI